MSSPAVDASLDVGEIATPESTTLRKVSRRIVPFVFALYVVNFLDRVNVGFAALQMNRDLGLSSAVYGFGAGIFFVGYCLFDVPSNLALARVGARRWIARIMISWGIIACAMMLVRGPASFYVLRFLLGVAEAGFFPGIIFYLSHWFPARQRARTISRFMTAVPISAVIGGPLSGALLGLDGRVGLRGWQWLFLGEGIPAVLLGVSVLWLLTERPDEARWLTASERDWLDGRLAAERERRVDRRDTSARRALASGVVWQLGALFFLMATGNYAFTFWAPMLIKSLTSVSDLGVGLISGAIGAVTVLGMVIVGAHSDRRNERVLHVAAGASVMALALLAAAVVPQPMLVLIAVSISAIAFSSSHGPFWTMPTEFLTGDAAAAGVALVCTLTNVGGIVGPSLVGVLKQRTGGFDAAFVALGCMACGAAALALRLRRSRELAPSARRALAHH